MLARQPLSISVPVLLLSAAFAGDPPRPLRAIQVEPDEQMNSRFMRTDGWIGGDGVYSVPLSDDSILWIFGDTLVGKVRDGKRSDVVMVNHTFAKQRGWDASAVFEFFVCRDPQDRPTSFVRPEGKDGYFWLWDAVVHRGKLYVLATRQTSPGTITAFDWKLNDQSLIIVDNPLDAPHAWRFRQTDLPFGVFTDEYEALWGMEILSIHPELYIYGSTRRQEGEPRSLVVAKVAPDDLTEFNRWMFYKDGQWQRDARQASPLTSGVGTEGSITWLPDRNRYVYVYSPPLDPRIMMRTAATPVGPWSEAVTVYTCPEAQWHERIFCYAGKARLVPGRRDELLISYATNSFEMLPDVLADARIYVPRFVRATLAD